MKFALINPNWNFEGSVYFGCRERHLPLELGYSKAALEEAGFEAEIIDAHMLGLAPARIRERVEEYKPDCIVVTTAPSYLFWRCPQPELKAPLEVMEVLRGLGAKKIIIGPHGSVTPKAVLNKLGADIAVMGEPETVLPEIGQRANCLSKVFSICFKDSGVTKVQGGPRSTDVSMLCALRWPAGYLQGHTHHHHRFGTRSDGLGAEVESSRGCPYSCTFCAKNEFRNKYRKRPLDKVLEELDLLASNGVEYVYFIDEIFMPDKALLEALASRPLTFGIQTRIDLWKPEMLSFLGAAGCVSIEAGVESISERGRSVLGKRCSATTGELAALLAEARKSVPFVQATLLDAHVDEIDAIEAWRDRLLEAGVWANKPVPLFPFPGSEEYSKRWGQPDDYAWERAHEYYVETNTAFSDIQDKKPLPIKELENI